MMKPNCIDEFLYPSTGHRTTYLQEAYCDDQPKRKVVSVGFSHWQDDETEEQ